MWRKYMRSYESLTYRKRYRCPICDEYKLNIIHDSALQCENECELSYEELSCKEEIKKIIDGDDFCKYYELNEIKDLFYEVSDKINNIFPKITDEPLMKSMSDKHKEEINELFNRCINIEEQLDDRFVKKANKNLFNGNEKSDQFVQVTNLLEDISYFLNLAWRDICLFYCSTELVKENFHTESFFFYNCIDYITFSVEKIYLLLGIYFDFNFSNKLSENKTFKIKKFIKKCDGYAEIKSELECVVSFIKDIRDTNNHDLTYINSIIIKDISRNPSKRELYDKDSTVVNKEKLKPKIDQTLNIIKKCYSVLEYIIRAYNDKGCEDKSIPIIQIITQNIHDLEQEMHKIKLRKINPNEEIGLLEKELKGMFKDGDFMKNSYSKDIFFRMNEVNKCLCDVFNIINTGNITVCNRYYIKNIFLDNIDEEYLLYSCIIRQYACYEKILKCIAEIDNRYLGIKYFNEIERKITLKEENELDKLVKEILEDEYYNQLEKIRNDIYHLIRPSLILDKEIVCYNMIDIICRNNRIIFRILDVILKL